MIIGYILIIVAVFIVAIIAFINQPSFGKAPVGERLERIKRSPNYRDGMFMNEHKTPLLVTDKGRIRSLLEFVFRKNDGLKPDTALEVVRTNLKTMERDEDFLVWFGHSSYFMQVDGKRVLVDPVFRMASPVSFINKPFKGTDIYHPEDMPDIDYLIITHDHWDHLDYHTVVELKDRVGKIVCGLGVGEHFEYWGFEKDRLVELDWHEDVILDTGFTIHCLPARHFSGRGITSNQTLWASFLLETPSQNIYMAGDGGYDTHFSAIGKRFPEIDLAILENGQYNEDWRYIHMMPQNMEQVVKDLGARKILTVHHSKYALARHRWDEPLKNALNIAKNDSLQIFIPKIGEVVYWMR